MLRYIKLMLQKSAIYEIRHQLGISKRGFPTEAEALSWYRNHYRQTKGEDYEGTFGFRYDARGYVSFEYEMRPNFIKVYAANPLDCTIPLDREAMMLAKGANIPDWAAPSFRLVILVGEPPEDIEVHLPDNLIAPLGELRVLVHPTKKLSLRKWRKTGEMMGLLPGKIDMWKVPGTITSYSSKRESKYELLYWQTYLAYQDAVYERRMRGQKGKRGLLIETAKILEKEYGWEYEPDSYTVRRYLDRAEKVWHISTH